MEPGDSGIHRMGRLHHFHTKHEPIWANDAILPKPELFRGCWGHFPYYSPPFGVTNRRELVAMSRPMKPYLIQIEF